MAQRRGDLSQALRHSITPWISPQLTSESDLDSTASVRASREYSWSNPTKVRYCLTGNSKRLVKLANQPGESIRCFLTIEPKTTSWEWTWLANFSRWVTREHEDTPIISQAVSTPRGLENYCLMKKTTRKHNRLRCFIRNGRRPERIRSIYNQEAAIESFMKRREENRGRKSAPSVAVGAGLPICAARFAPHRWRLFAGLLIRRPFHLVTRSLNRPVDFFPRSFHRPLSIASG